MITFRQFLNEGQSPFKNLIDTKCSGYIAESGMIGFLVRGMKRVKPDLEIQTADGTKVPYAICSTHESRRPLDTNTTMHDIVDDWFYDKFGWYARSENVLFCLGDADVQSTEMYGNAFMVFPIGNDLKYVWSNDITDLSGRLWAVFGNDEIEQKRSRIEMELDKANFINTDLKKAIKVATHEIMINCKQYIVVPWKYHDVVKQDLGMK